MVNFSASVKALIAAAVAAPLVLSGCGKEAEEATEASSAATSTTAPASQTTTAPPAPANTASAVPAAPPQPSAPAAPSPKPAPPAGAQAEQNNTQPAPGQSAPQDNNDLPITTVAPIPGGQPASGQDAEAIRALVTGFNDETSMRRKMEYLPQHTCSRVIQENGGPEAFDFSAIPDVNLAEMPGGEQYNSSVTEVRDIVVDGDQASATVVATSNNGPSEATQRFSRENGAWTFCN
ncbi:hypothetical protein H7347_01490 [Corynebacterium sp. zg-331]|uniref:Rv0361 family membrane protein n=1 Tax=unclassified Corynebacterium TaxID=2624378 RepID=UPI00128DCE1B|nr:MULTISPECIES: hypothetical protein [unclassified Corynebacterium]MBC3185260.1 hypothetical protein [Corynebacterium sp. zg-331]MPV51757.1 hypothetical protein [Corynebacterium sp. zg331]